MNQADDVDDLRLQTERTVITVCSVSDAAVLFRTLEGNRLQLQDSFAWMDWAHSEGDVCRYLRELQTAFRTRTGACLKIEVQGELIGILTLMDVEHLHRRARLECWLSAEAVGSGYMREAAMAVIAFVFQEWNLHRLEYRCPIRHRRAFRLGVHIGMQLEGILAEARQMGNQFVDQALFGTTRPRWEAWSSGNGGESNSHFAAVSALFSPPNSKRRMH